MVTVSVTVAVMGTMTGMGTEDRGTDFEERGVRRSIRVRKSVSRYMSNYA